MSEKISTIELSDFEMVRIRIIDTDQKNAAPSTISAGMPKLSPAGLQAINTPKKPIAEAPTRARVSCSLRKITARTIVSTGAK